MKTKGEKGGYGAFGLLPWKADKSADCGDEGHHATPRVASPFRLATLDACASASAGSRPRPFSCSRAAKRPACLLALGRTRRACRTAPTSMPPVFRPTTDLVAPLVRSLGALAPSTVRATTTRARRSPACTIRTVRWASTGAVFRHLPSPAIRRVRTTSARAIRIARTYPATAGARQPILPRMCASRGATARSTPIAESAATARRAARPRAARLPTSAIRQTTSAPTTSIAQTALDATTIRAPLHGRAAPRAPSPLEFLVRASESEEG
jgi:hypothetical protein